VIDARLRPDHNRGTNTRLSLSPFYELIDQGFVVQWNFLLFNTILSGKRLDHLHLRGMVQAVFRDPMQDFYHIPGSAFTNWLIEQAGVKVNDRLDESPVGSFDQVHFNFPLFFVNRIHHESPASFPWLKSHQHILPAGSIRHTIFPKCDMQGNLADIIRARIRTPYGYHRVYPTQNPQSGRTTMPGWIPGGGIDGYQGSFDAGIQIIHLSFSSKKSEMAEVDRLA
jgi:hypothetical protein